MKHKVALRWMMISMSIFMVGWAETSGLKMGISPSSFYYEFAPGKSQSGAFMVMNGGDNALEIKVYAHDVVVDNKGEIQFVSSNRKIKYSLAPWIKFDPPRFNLEGNTNRLVRFEIAPEASIYGARSAVVLAEGIDFNQPNATLLLSGRVGAWVQADLFDTDHPRDPLMLEAKKFDVYYMPEKQKLKFELMLFNPSNQLIKSKANITIFDSDGTLIQAVPLSKFNMLDEHQFKLFPYLDRVVWGECTANITDGTYKIVLDWDYGGNEVLQIEKTLSVRSKLNVSQFNIDLAKYNNPIIFSFHLINEGNTILNPKAFVTLKKYNGQPLIHPIELREIPLAPSQHERMAGIADVKPGVEEYIAQLEVLYGNHQRIQLEKKFMVDRVVEKPRIKKPKITQKKKVLSRDTWN